MGWALQLYLPGCIFNAAILNHYIFFSLPWNEASRRSCGELTQNKDRQSSLNKVCRWPPANMFALNKSHNNQLLGLRLCVCHSGLRWKKASCWIKLENNCLSSVITETCCLMTSVYVANRTETRAQHVGCSVVINTGMRSASTIRQSKQRNFPNRLTTPGHRDMRGLIQKPTALTKQTSIILFLNLSWKIQIRGLVPSGRTEQIKAGHSLYML